MPWRRVKKFSLLIPCLDVHLSPIEASIRERSASIYTSEGRENRKPSEKEKQLMKKMLATLLMAVPMTFAAQTPAATTAPAPVQKTVKAPKAKTVKIHKVRKSHKKTVKTAKASVKPVVKG
jgi:hypothetical protein